MQDEVILQRMYVQLKQQEDSRPPLAAPGAPVRRTPLETRAYEQGRLAMLAEILSVTWHPESCDCGNCRDADGVRHPVVHDPMLGLHQPVKISPPLGPNDV